MDSPDWLTIHTHILQLEQEGRVTRTFRRLDPDRQMTVLTAILDEAAEHGPASLNIKQVAERAGVSVGSLYTYFTDRDGMLDFAVELSSRFLIESLNGFRAFLVEMPLREGLAAYLAGGVEWSQTYAGLLRLFVRAAYQGELSGKLVQPIADALLDMVRAMLAAAVERGEVRPDVDLDAAAHIVHALTIAVGDSQLLPYLNIYFQVTSEAIPPERALTAAIDLILKGIGPL